LIDYRLISGPLVELKISTDKIKLETFKLTVYGRYGGPSKKSLGTVTIEVGCFLEEVINNNVIVDF